MHLEKIQLRHTQRCKKPNFFKMKSCFFVFLGLFCFFVFLIFVFEIFLFRIIKRIKWRNTVQINQMHMNEIN